MEGTAMREEVTRLRIFVASPGDVKVERDHVSKVINDLNKGVMANKLKLFLQMLDWRNLPPEMGRPQQVILDQLPLETWDIFIGILWSHFGTPPGAIHPETGEPYLSGTHEEFNSAYRLWKKNQEEEKDRPRILIYRCKRSIPADSDPNQLKLVQDFFAGFEVAGTHPGLYQTYETNDDFARRLRNDLEQVLYEFSEEKLAKMPEEEQKALRVEAELERDPLHLPFANREYEMDVILSPFAPAYFVLDAPAGYGKTTLLKELKRRFKEGWVCAYGCAEEHSSLLSLANALAQELSISLTIDSNARLLGANLARAIKQQKEDVIAQEGLVLLIDLGKRPSLEMKDLLEEFIPGVQDNLRDLKFFAIKHNRFRVIIAGRSLAGRKEIISASLLMKVLKLTPFDYEVVRDAARDYLPARAEDSIRQIAAHVTHITGGHPGCMARILKMYRESGFSPDDFLTSYADDIRDIVLREVEDVRNDIRSELRSTLDNLCIFRHFDYGMLRRLISGDAPLIRGYTSEYDLADELTGTYLLHWKGRLLRDDTTRRLLAIRLRQEVGTKEFSSRCRQAQAICAEYLEDPTIQMPEMWAIEFIFQFLQQYAGAIQTLQRRGEIRQDFFGEAVPKALQLLVKNRDARVEQNALERALETDWEFRFMVNYFLRQDEYSDEPYREFQRRMDDFL
jgi:hypothetical protein